MRRGRKPTPTPLKVVAGNPGKRPLPENEPKPQIGPIEPPPAVADNDLALAEWNYIVPLMVSARIVSQVDRAALAAYCESYARWMACEDLANKSVPLVMGSNDVLKENPAMRVARLERRECIRYAAELGITPSARTRVVALPEDKMDPSERHFNKGTA